MPAPELIACPRCGNRYDPLLRESCPLCANDAVDEAGGLVLESPSREDRSVDAVVAERIAERWADEGMRRRVPAWAYGVLLLAVASGALLCLIGLNLRAGSDSLLSLALAEPPPTVAPAVAPVDEAPPGGVLRIQELRVVAGDASGDRARVDLVNVSDGPLRELLVQLAGVDARGRPFRTEARRVPSAVAPGRSVRLEIEVPARARVERVIASQWIEHTEALELRALTGP